MKKKKTLRGLKAKAWKVFSEWIRRRSADVGGTDHCFTCGRAFFWKELQAGHAIGGRTNAVLFDDEICRPQCVGCNVFNRGAYPVFTAKLIRERGLEWFEKKLAGARVVKKYTRADLEELILAYKKKLEAIDGRTAKN